ncbi:trafficking kinesin-binding protein 2 isoform X2 [Neopsephotus bourkii]|uniref:trafficking kinesin-binding protein 2 isoform X2 n=1 Tax=Neopsephotus bourkii TaxID=309878 RepID=UPI002AA5CE20|nr:trafficking kinesin-binding protein 2 isoform X2 [Neopsephotus bourkii]
MNFDHKGLESISDVCSSEDLPEVELVSMLEEQLPDYKLRVDSLYLYENRDWIQSPACHSHLPEISSPVRDEELFHYMTLIELPSSSLAVSRKFAQDNVEQKAYTDADMVKHLLAEKDRDLELAARIGQALLKRNHLLTEQNEALEEQLGQTLDRVNQLQHELSKKDDLLRIVSIASEESETDSSCSTPLRFNESFNVPHDLLQLDVLQDKLRELEEENLALRSKACHLKTETITYEEKEQQLVNDCVKELRQTNAQICRITEELSEKSEELVRYQEEISSLLSQIVDLQHKLKELHELQDRNAECLGMLHESQEEVKLLRSRARSVACLCHPQSSCGAFLVDSLAAEIEGTMRKELSQGDESVLSKQKDQQKRVFDTVRVANVTRGRSSSFPAPLPIPGSNRSSAVMTAKPFQSGVHQLESHARVTQRSSSEKNLKDTRNPGQPGIPGDNDLVTALHRLSLRRQNYLSEKQFFEEEWERKMHLLADQKEGASGCSTPTESCFSLGTNSEVTDLSASSNNLRVLLPEKLQIVKPIEGSQTLFHWQQLARPNLGTILDPRPGVVTKGFTPLSDDAVHHISDLEEDDEEGGGITFQVQQSVPEEKKCTVAKPVAGIFLPPITSAGIPLTASNPGKCLSSTNSTFTFTTCRILHPSDVTQVTPSSVGTPFSLGSSGSSIGNPVVSTPTISYRLSIGEFLTNRRDSTTTFSSTRSLAKLLQERGISAKVYDSPILEKLPLLQPPRTLPIPSTPPNSPSRSPCPSPPLFEPRVHHSENFLASRPAETFLQEVYGLKPSRNAPDVGQQKMNLVDRLKRLGIARVIKPPETQDYLNNQEPDVSLRRQDSAVFLNAGTNLMAGLRRNQSLPAMIGALGAPVCTQSSKMDILKED